MGKIVIFGATGFIGLCAVEAALKKGLAVRAFVRDEALVPAALRQHAALELCRGNVLEPDSVHEAVAGTDGVVVALGTRNSLAPTTDLSEGTKVILEAMRAEGVRRVAACLSGFLFAETDKVPAVFADITADHRRMYDALRDSGLDWVAVFPPHFTEEPSRELIVEVNPDKSPGRTISKWDLGAFLVDALDRPEYRRSVIGICNKPLPPPPAAAAAAET